MKTIALTLLICCLIGTSASIKAQKATPAVEVGQVELGIRSTMSLWDEEFNPGLGYGGHFRIRPLKRLNTEWYADYIKTGIPDVGHRETVHIGWSVIFYPFNSPSPSTRVAPYILAGHCFDYARIHTYGSEHTLKHTVETTATEVPDTPSRLTTAVQLGLGTQFQLNDRFNASVSGQYMYHIGNSLDGANDAGENDVVLEGHMLFTLSLNYMLLDFVQPRI